MTPEQQVAFFEANDYVAIPGALPRALCDQLNAAMDRHRETSPSLWTKGARMQSVHMILTAPEFDVLLRHPCFIDVAKAVVGQDVVFAEFSAMIRAGNQKPGVEGWHRDFGVNTKHRLGITGLSVIFYLSDVDRTTARYTLIPASHAREEQPEPVGPDSVDVKGEVEILGPAGTCIVVNAGIWHAGKWGDGPRERRTVHLYLQSPNIPPVSQHSIFPRRLWDVSDADQRRYYSHFNGVTEAVAKAFNER